MAYPGPPQLFPQHTEMYLTEELPELELNVLSLCYLSKPLSLSGAMNLIVSVNESKLKRNRTIILFFFK